MSWRRLWGRLSVERRREAGLDLFRGGQADVSAVQAALRHIATARSLRIQTVEAMTPEARAEHLARVSPPPGEVIAGALISYHFVRQVPLLSRFMDLLEIHHTAGHIAAQTSPRPQSERLVEAVRALTAEFPPDDVTLYLDTLELTDPDFWTGLGLARAALAPPAHPMPSPPEPAPAPPPAATPVEVDLRAEPRAEGFTTLDRLLTRSIVDTISGVAGALGIEQLDDLVGEVVQLNSVRHASYFHRGFLDALLGRTVNLDFPEANADRRAWLLSGAVHALARRGEHRRLLGLLSEHEAVRDHLLRRRHPSGEDLPALVFEALRAEGRATEFTRWVTPAAAAHAPVALWEGILAVTTDLVHDLRAEEAQPLLQFLADTLDLAAGADRKEEAEALRPDLRRRLAHCLRLRGDKAGARAHLQRILDSAEYDRAGMILADIGLIDSNFRSLAEVRLPSGRSACADTAAALAHGEDLFTKAVAHDGGDAGHGSYCLGVFETARGRLHAAVPHLERAVALMGQRPNTYRRPGILPRARLYLGAALADGLDPARAPFAAECLEDAAAALGREVLPFLPAALQGLETADAALAARLAASLHQHLGADLLDSARSAGLLAHVPALREGVLARTEATGRTAADRFEDYSALLQAARSLSDRALGEQALDGLEVLAMAGFGRDRLLAVLDRPDDWSFAWDHEDAQFCRVRLLEAEGRTADAAALLVRLAHQVLARRDHRGRLAEAEDLAAHIRTLGVPADPTLSDRLLAERYEVPAPEPADRSARGAILVIGGNETQARYDEPLRREARARWPDVELRFEHPGWESTWARRLERFDGNLARASAVVLLRFVRTNLGCEVRRRCGARGIPWVACTGHGRDSILHAVEEAIRLLLKP